MNFNNIEVRKVINNASTRWLILGKYLEKAMMQLYFLEPYFLSNFDLDGGPTETDPDERPSREKKLINEFKEPTSKLYSMFVQSVIPIFDSFVTFLQAE